MLPLIERHRAAVEAACRKYRVRRLELFGSVAPGEFDPAASDIDLFVEFQDLGWQGSFKRYMGLKLDIEDLLGRPVDLIEPKTVTSPYFRQVSTRHTALVYAA